MTQCLLNIRQLHKSFGDVQVLKGVDLEVMQGEVMSIIGSSGSGKTTLLRCVNLLEDFQEGDIIIDQQPIGYRMHGGHRRAITEKEKSKQRALTGMVFQAFNLFPHLSALGNVALGLRKVMKLPRKVAEEQAAYWLDRVGLGNRKDYYPSQLSGGQQQRVGIARALAMKPKLMLFDEVTSALDPELVGEVLQVMTDLAGDGMTMLVVTHEIAFARDVSNRIVFMHDGIIAEEGPPNQIINSPEHIRLQEFLARSRS
ncbi:MAG: amino acid ABC transporter ATP-binding protein [Rhodobacteraceae bacterium]|nr:amino acid ABC transporter ATP-binding protein [Paracoccaceae bacterium]